MIENKVIIYAPETMDAIIDGTLVQRLLKDIDDLVDIASEFDM